MNEKTITLKFYKRDFLFDNGIVNILLALEELIKENVINENDFNIKFTSSYLSITGYREVLDSLYKQVYIKIASKIIHWTNNHRYYWDENNKKLVLQKKFDLAGRSSGNDIKRIALKNQKTLKELNITSEDLIQQLNVLFPESSFEDKLPINKSNKEKQILTINQLLKENFSIPDINSITIDSKLQVFKSLKELAEIEFNITIGNNIKDAHKCFICNEDIGFLEFNTNVHMFDASFGNQKIGKWAYLIYRAGTRIQRYFNESDKKQYFYLHSYSLINLYEIKKRIQVQDSKVVVKNKDGIEETKSNNFHFFHDIELDKYNFYTYGQNDRLLNLLVGIYKTQKIEAKKASNSGDLDLDIFENSSIASFSDNGIVKDALSFYNKLSTLFRLFEHLEQKTRTTRKSENLPLFDLLFKKGSLFNNLSLIQLFANGATTNKDDKDKILLQSWVDKFLNFQPLHDIYLILQFNLLTMSNDGKTPLLPDELSSFEEAYIQLTIGSNSPEALIHSLAHKVGREMGRFLGFTKNKDLLFTLRAVNNRDQLVQFIRDFRFKYLKESKSEDNNDFNFAKDFNENLDLLLNIIANNKKIEMIRDYLALYCISGYSIGSYHSR